MSRILELSNTKLIQRAVENGEGELVANGAFNAEYIMINPICVFNKLNSFHSRNKGSI